MSRAVQDQVIFREIYPRGNVRHGCFSVTLMEYEGHQYLISSDQQSISMVHSESCPCKRKGGDSA